MKYRLIRLVALAGLLAVTSSPSYSFGLPKLPSSLGGGGGGTDALTEQAKVKTVDSIFSEINKGAFEGGKLILSKKKWACEKLDQANKILSAISQPQLSSKAADLYGKLFCGITTKIPAEFLAPEKPAVDAQKV
jgi:hypothetical protein